MGFRREVLDFRGIGKVCRVVGRIGSICGGLAFYVE